MSQPTSCPPTSNPNPVKAIRMKCLECSGGATSEVERCVIPECPLYPFRFGKNPYRQKREMSEEQREAASKRLAEARESRRRAEDTSSVAPVSS